MHLVIFIPATFNLHPTHLVVAIGRFIQFLVITTLLMRALIKDMDVCLVAHPLRSCGLVIRSVKSKGDNQPRSRHLNPEHFKGGNLALFNAIPILFSVSLGSQKSKHNNRMIYVL